MDNNNQDFQRQLNAVIDNLNRLASDTNTTATQLAEARSKLRQITNEMPVGEIMKLRRELSDNSKELIDVFDNAISRQMRNAVKIEELSDKLDTVNSEIEDLGSAINTANRNDRRYLEERQRIKQKEKDDLEAEIEAIKQGKENQYRIERELAERNREASENNRRALESDAKQTRDSLFGIVKSYFQEVVNYFYNSASKVADSYERSAGSLAAALNSTVDDIGNLQRKIATELRDTSLSKAISNIAVMTEAASFVQSGYTNESKLQANATAVAISKEIAPNLDFNNASVKNLTNVFGSDFISKFAAIQTAVQDTAGSTININQNLSSMISSLEPVIANAEYQNLATQDLSDIQATLSSAIDNGLITQSDANQFQNMIAELMDPSKAFKSNNTAVRLAATMYDFGSGSPLQALEAIKNANEALYSNVGQGSNYWDNISRGLVASAFNNPNTMSATYKPSSLYGFDILRTENLDTVYQNKVNNLESGDFTTVLESYANRFENSKIVQGMSKLAETAPLTYNALVKGFIAQQLISMPNRIANAIKASGVFNTSGAGGLPGNIGEGGGNWFTASQTNTATTGIRGAFNRAQGFGGNFANASIMGLGQAGSRLGRLTSGLTMGAGLAGIMGLMSTAGQWDNDRSFVSNVGHGGDIGSAMLSTAGMGAGLGAVIGSIIPGLGNIAGTLIGGIGGAIIGLTTALIANKEVEEENTKKMEEQTKATKDLLGQGVVGVDALEAKAEIAKGGGLAHLKSGDYRIDYTKSNYPGFATGLDYVPYDDYIVRAHKGEAIVTAEAAEVLRKKNPSFWNTPMNEDNNIVGALKEQTESIVSAVNGDKQYQPMTRQGPKQYKIVNAYA